MLRITNSVTTTEQRWILSGQLAGPWVGELRSNWHKELDASRKRRLIVDLSEVTFIDESGESLLHELRSSGAEFAAGGGVETRDLLENLRASGIRPVRKYLARHEGRNDETDLGKSDNSACYGCGRRCH
jgi:hypothetical protein